LKCVKQTVYVTEYMIKCTENFDLNVNPRRVVNNAQCCYAV